jgi:5-(hydroxymethyl)furfural/furfural oxidase
MIPQFDEKKIFDVIIVGAGPAGCVLASRLSEEPGRQILLIEAGPDVAAPGKEHPDVLDQFALNSTNNDAFHWPDLVAEVGADLGKGAARVQRPYIQAHGVGGASNINGMGADRGQPGDYDEWLDLGADGWGWKDVLPYFKKLEHDLDYADNTAGAHGASGPLPVRRLSRAHWAPFSAAMANALQRRGFPFIEDYNGDFCEGVSSAPTNSLPSHRVSASMAYLTRAVRQRPNLTILANAKVDRISLQGKRANGVFMRACGTASHVRGQQIVVSCGAIQSPALLMRSGIGSAAQLDRHGIGVVQDLRGVGANLQNHPYVSLVVYLPRGSAQPADNPWFLQNWVRFSSNHPECISNDMHLIPLNKCAWHDLGRHIGVVVLSVFKPYSKGSVELSDPDPARPPNVRFNLLADPRDSERLVLGIRFVLELLTDPAVTKVRGQIFYPDGRVVAGLGRRSAWNRFRARAITFAFERERLRALLLAKSSIDPHLLLRDEHALRDLVRRDAQPQYHVCGTCRMGRAGDPDAVVDSVAFVRGMEALRVVDASIFPAIPRANTHLTVVMAAEKIADVIKSEWCVGRSTMQYDDARGQSKSLSLM